MIAKKVTRYFADCGKEYHNKYACMSHDIVCRCWTNPKHKTCVTCKFGKFIKDSNGMEDEPQYLETWRQWDCKNPEFNYDTMYTQADGDNTNSLCKNCPKWEQYIKP